ARSSNRICRFLAFGGRFPCKSIFEDSLESQAVSLLARADAAGDLRCDHASDGRPVSRICSAHGLTRSRHETRIGEAGAGDRLGFLDLTNSQPPCRRTSRQSGSRRAPPPTTNRLPSYAHCRVTYREKDRPNDAWPSDLAETSVSQKQAVRG